MLIPAGNPSLWTGPTGTNTYLLTGRVPTLIDAGVGQRAHVDAVAGALEGRELAAVLLTHSHSDHASGVPAVLERWPRAIVRPPAAPLADGEVIEAGDRHLRALYTPGHAPDHFCFADDERREVYCGDLLRLGGTVVIPASRGGDLMAYLASLERIRALAPSRIWPGHGPAIDDVEALIAQYLAHRQEREQQVLDALRAGHQTPEEMVPSIYGRLPSALLAGAADSLLAHLKKLEAEGGAIFEDQRWRLVRSARL